MAAAAATEDDAELRDLLVQTLETSGVLNKIKAELRAAVFLALEEQEKVENKTPLVNENLRKFLNTKDGRLVAGLVAEFLQFFNLDFTLAVFQPESSTLNGLENRENLARDLGIIEAKTAVDGPLLLEVVRRCQQKNEVANNGEVGPIISDNVHTPTKSSDGKPSIHSLPSKVTEICHNDTNIFSGDPKSKGSTHPVTNEIKLNSQPNHDIHTKEKNYLAEEEDDAEGDSFFDDPIPKQERPYSWKNDSNKEGNIASLSDAPPLKSSLSLTGTPLLKETDNAKLIMKDVKVMNSRLGSLYLGDEDEYADDFNSTSHRSEKSEASIGEEIDEISVDLEDFNPSDKLEDLTQDLTISQLSGDADYLEDVA